MRITARIRACREARPGVGPGVDPVECQSLVRVVERNLQAYREATAFLEVACLENPADRQANQAEAWSVQREVPPSALGACR